jgi:hypothetical protein
VQLELPPLTPPPASELGQPLPALPPFDSSPDEELPAPELALQLTTSTNVPTRR